MIPYTVTCGGELFSCPPMPTVEATLSPTFSAYSLKRATKSWPTISTATDHLGLEGYLWTLRQDPQKVNSLLPPELSNSFLDL